MSLQSGEGGNALCHAIATRLRLGDGYAMLSAIITIARLVGSACPAHAPIARGGRLDQGSGPGLGRSARYRMPRAYISAQYADFIYVFFLTQHMIFRRSQSAVGKFAASGTQFPNFRSR